jgi:hypothetical protein
MILLKLFFTKFFKYLKNGASTKSRALDMCKKSLKLLHEMVTNIGLSENGWSPCYQIAELVYKTTRNRGKINWLPSGND